MGSNLEESSQSRWRSVASTILLLCGMTAWNVFAFSPEEARERLLSPEFNPLPRPENVRVFSMGLQATIADYYWIQAVNYFGNGSNESVCFAQLPGYIRLIVDLAPDFESAYRFGGLTIPCFNGKDWVNADEAISVLREGVKRFPTNYTFQSLLAFYLSDIKHDYPASGAQLTEAAKLPNSPPWIGQLATRMYAAAGDLDKASLVADDLIRSLNSDDVRETLRKRKAEIETLKQLKTLNALRQAYEDSQHQRLTSVEDLVRVGQISALPTPALGGRFEYDARSNEIVSPELHDMLKIFENKQRILPK